MKRARILIGISILIVSLALLIWGILPARREVRTQPIPPAELQLPVPTSLRVGFRPG